MAKLIDIDSLDLDDEPPKYTVPDMAMDGIQRCDISERHPL